MLRPFRAKPFFDVFCGPILSRFVRSSICQDLGYCTGLGCGYGNYGFKYDFLYYLPTVAGFNSFDGFEFGAILLYASEA